MYKDVENHEYINNIINELRHLRDKLQIANCRHTTDILAIQEVEFKLSDITQDYDKIVNERHEVPK